MDGRKRFVIQVSVRALYLHCKLYYCNFCNSYVVMGISMDCMKGYQAEFDIVCVIGYGTKGLVCNLSKEFCNVPVVDQKT